MRLRSGRRFFATLIAMLFVLSIAGHGVMMGAMVAKAVATTGVLSLQAPASECNDGCGSDSRAMQIACFAQCASTVGIVSDLIEPPAAAVIRDAPVGIAQALSSRNRPPDPYPPKSFVLI